MTKEKRQRALSLNCHSARTCVGARLKVDGLLLICHSHSITHLHIILRHGVGAPANRRFAPKAAEQLYITFRIALRCAGFDNRPLTCLHRLAARAARQCNNTMICNYFAVCDRIEEVHAQTKAQLELLHWFACDRSLYDSSIPPQSLSRATAISS